VKRRVIFGKTESSNGRGDCDLYLLCRNLEITLQKSQPLFGNYQDLPSAVRRICPDLEYKKNQLSLDLPRWEFLRNQMRLESVRAVEIGSNLGYFCLQIAQQKKCEAFGYEPSGEFSEAASLMAKILNVSNRCVFFKKKIGLRNIHSLPQADLYIELNVLHHAGAIYDVEQADNRGNWRQYAVERLKRIRARSERLLFQTGNSRGKKTLFSPASSIVRIRRILEEAGWTPIAVGWIPDLSRLNYEIFTPREFHRIPLYRCVRNPLSGLVEYWLGTKLMAELATGLAARPIWFCV